MAVPKKKMSKSKTHMRRSHDALVAHNRGSCPQCGEPKLPHRVRTTTRQESCGSTSSREHWVAWVSSILR